MYGFDFVNPFAGEASFTIKILINIRNGAGVNIETSLAGINAGQA
jgi:hypothetical protein